ncbi:MAG: lipid-A-disaccharide synthase [Deltaproteobacteria bacterium]|nr:lipid-A-disaccharide synthase [Deltaproteobacteria bacterium]
MSMKSVEGSRDVVHKAVKICIISGENSGDFHGANLALAIRKRLPGVQIDGVGGSRMAAAGVSLIFQSSRLSVVGITEVIGRIPSIVVGWRRIKTYLQQQRPDLVVLIDFPDFNLYLVAPQVKKLGIPLVYYISPQLWAWRQGRIKKIRTLVDRMLVILPFEQDFYRQSGVPVRYTGHPLVDEFAGFKVLPRSQRPYIALLPGSRPTEVKRLLPIMLEAAVLIRKNRPEQEFILPLVPSLDEDFLKEVVPEGLRNWVTPVRKPLSASLRDAFFAIVASGTATLETALAGVPMVVVYRVGKLSYLIGKKLISVPHISLVNLIAGSEVVPELIQDDVDAQNICLRAEEIIDHQDKFDQVVEGLREVKSLLGPTGGAERAAREVVDCLKI